MSDEKPETWPLRPSHSSYVLQGLSMALSDLVHQEGGGEVSRRALSKMCGVASAAELFASEVAHFFGSRMGNDHEVLEELQEKYVKEETA